MPIPTPILDDRSYQQLRDELVRRIPVYAPEWTDHNASDPGITLIELFAWLGETLLFRFNQIPETTRLEFLRLLQIPLRPAQPARALLALTAKPAGGLPAPAGTVAQAGKVQFETVTEATVWPLGVRAAAKVAGPAPEDAEALEFVQRTLDALDQLGADEEPAYYVTSIVPDDPAKPDAVPVDLAASVDGTLWVALLREDTTDVTKLAGRVVNLGVVLDPVVPSMAEVDPCPGAGPGNAPPSVAWQILSPDLDDVRAPKFRPLGIVGDTTRGLSQDGVVRLELPRDPLAIAVPAIPDPDLAGTGGLPPVLADDELVAKVVAWIRAFRLDGSALPRVQWVGVNATEVVQSRKAGAELLGTGNGQPEQRFRLVNRQVVPGSIVLEVEEVDGWRAWTEVDGFHASAEDDRHYVLDAEAGEVRFGLVTQGRVPQIAERVRARTYRHGGGRAGNVGARAIKVDAGGVKGDNPLPATGGADAESVEDGLERIPGELRRRDRAVTRDDFRELALATPGADVGRAEVLPLFHPRNPDIEAAGVVTVVVWPRQDRRRPDAPLPDRTLLRAVCAWLDARRLVTTELYVVPPTYRKVAVSVGVKVADGYGVDAVRRWVELVVRQYLAPLPPFGPTGGGWPLGHRVHGPELEAAALQVEGVEYIERRADGPHCGIEVAGFDEATGQWVEGTVALRPYEVPHLVAITVVSGAPQPVTESLAPPPPAKRPVPIPTLREEC